MPFVEISGKHIRNLEDFRVIPSPQNNLIFGKNGAGKTSLLESLYLNSLGRSFKTSSLSNIINESSNSCLVFSRYWDETLKSGHKIGLQRWRGNKQTIKLDERTIQSLSPLAQLIPILAVLPGETLLVDGGSAIRRKYLDWIMFHVEPRFLPYWKQHQNLLKQRNHLLRSAQKHPRQKKDLLLELSSWDRQFVDVNEQVNRLREPVFRPLIEKTRQTLSRLPAFKGLTDNVSGEFYKGWSSKEPGFEKVLRDGLEQDLKVGFTKHGAHRADFQLQVNNSSAREYLSSGQKKLLSIAMRLAQAQELSERAGKAAVLLVDDLFAELDDDNIEAFISLIEEMNLQTFFTSLQGVSDSRFFKKEVKMFHVEQGYIRAFSR